MARIAAEAHEQPAKGDVDLDGRLRLVLLPFIELAVHGIFVLDVWASMGEGCEAGGPGAQEHGLCAGWW